MHISHGIMNRAWAAAICWRQRAARAWVRGYSTSDTAVPVQHPAVCVWGANTGVGKTLISAGLAQAAIRANRHLLYLKPVQTGYPADSDSRLVEASCQAVAAARHSHDAARAPSFTSRVLFTYADPVSPHVAAAAEQRVIPDDTIIRATRQELQQFATGVPADSAAFVVVETAGGVASPGPSGSLQGNLLAPLRLPALLVGDPALGGISTTLTAYEALLLRGHAVAAVTMMREGRYDNYAAVARHLSGAAAHRLGQGLPVVPLPLCRPPKDGQAAGAAAGALDDHLSAWLAESAPGFDQLLQLLVEQHQERTTRLQQAAATAKRSVWWPFTQHAALPDSAVMVVEARAGEDWMVFHDTPGMPSTSKATTSSSSSSSSPSGHSASSSQPAQQQKEWRQPVLQPYYDACSSWWTQTVTAALQPEVVKAVAAAAGRYGHILWPEVAHAPGLQLTQQILSSPLAAGWGGKVFYSDDGSTGIEVALKMAFRKFMVDHGLLQQGQVELQVLALHNNYHGDTLGAMDCAASSPYNGRGQTPWYTGRGLFLEPPYLQLQRGQWQLQLPPWLQQAAGQVLPNSSWPAVRSSLTAGSGVFDVQARGTSQLQRVYQQQVAAAMDAFKQQHSHSSSSQADSRTARLGALLMEPLLQGAGGMLLVDPLFQKVLVQECRSRGIPVIFDEVFTGCWRLGLPTGGQALGETPDIAVYGKLLTGGMVPLAATVATDAVFDAFQGPSKVEALLHGHSYTAYPIACAAAAASLHLLQAAGQNPNLCTPEVPGGCPANPTCKASCGCVRSQWSMDAASQLSNHPLVAGVVAAGSVLAVEVQGASGGYLSTAAAGVVQALRQRGVFCRPLGGVVYIMVTPTTPAAKCEELLQKLQSALQEVWENREQLPAGAPDGPMKLC